MVATLDDMIKYPDWPRLLSRVQAAAYCGISPSHFDELVEQHVLPGCLPWETRRCLWDRKTLDYALDLLSGLVGPTGILSQDEFDPISAATDAYHAERD